MIGRKSNQKQRGMVTLKIRRAKAEDIPDLDRLLRQVLMIHHRGRPDLFQSGVKKYTDQELQEMMGEDARPIFVCVEGQEEKVLGYAFCMVQRHTEDPILTDRSSLYIDDLCVDEQYRGRHIGRTLYEYILEFARQHGFYNVTLNVWPCNPDAMAFYRSCGLTPQKVGMEKIL